MREQMERNIVRFRRSQLVYLKFKRLMDILFSLTGLILLLPLFAVVSLAIKLEEPAGSIIYSQERIGRRGNVFRLYKFRSMYMGAPELSTHEFRDARQYVTHVGKIIRRTSIDELPQLWNVLKGDMSLVGPRPLLTRERDVHMKRFFYGLYQVRPGITGMAQTHGRDDMSDDIKVAYDRQYVENVSLLLDFKLLILTGVKVLSRDGVRDAKKAPEDSFGIMEAEEAEKVEGETVI